MKTTIKKNEYWLSGRHSVIAALKNSRRQCKKLVISREALTILEKAAETDALLESRLPLIKMEINRNMPAYCGDMPNQGMMLLTTPLYHRLEETKLNGTIILLDKLSDPHNIGAIIRSAAAFDVSAVIATKDGSPEENATMCKSSSGMIELIPYIRVTNIARTIQLLQKQHNYIVIGLDGKSDTAISTKHFTQQNIAIALGSEGKGLRSLTKQNCDYTVSIPMANGVESLNVSNAAAIALYASYQRCDAN